MPTLFRWRSISGIRRVMPDASIACPTVDPAGRSSWRTVWLWGRAYTTSTAIAGSCASINLFRALDESLHETVGDDEEDGSHQLFQKQVGEGVMQTEFDLAGVFRKGNEAPMPVQVLERAVQQRHGDQFRRVF